MEIPAAFQNAENRNHSFHIGGRRYDLHQVAELVEGVARMTSGEIFEKAQEIARARTAKYMHDGRAYTGTVADLDYAVPALPNCKDYAEATSREARLLMRETRITKEATIIVFDGGNSAIVFGSTYAPAFD